MLQESMAKIRFQPRRSLQLDDTRACGETIGIVSKDSVADLGNILLQNTLVGPLATFIPTAETLLLGNIKYDLRAVKVCYSCEQAFEDYAGFDFLNDAEGYGSFLSYCDPSVYGADATHSALAFVPLIDGVPVSGTVRSFLYSHILQTGAEGAPSQLWPRNFESLFGLPTPEFIAFMIDFIESLMTASTGVVAILPDELGYGESLATHNRTAAVKAEFGMQAGAVSCLAAIDYLQGTTNGCTRLDSVVTVAGSSQGGYLAVPMAVALERMGNRVLHVFSGAAFMDAEIQFKHAIDSFLTNAISADLDNVVLAFGLAFAAFVSSVETPGLANTGTGQVLLNDAFRDPTDISTDLIEWYASPDPLSFSESSALIPIPATSVLVDDMVELFFAALQGNISSPCTSDLVVQGTTDKLCEILTTETLFDKLPLVEFPVTLCHSPGDTVNPPLHFPPSLFEGNRFVNEATSILNGLIDVTGDHFAAIITCKILPVSFFTVPSQNDTDLPNLIVALGDEDQARCAPFVAGTGSDAPSLSPTLTGNDANIPSALPTVVQDSSSGIAHVGFLSNMVICMGLFGWHLL